MSEPTQAVFDGLGMMHHRFVDIAGQTFGRWTVLALATQGAQRRYFWLCRCVCGTERNVSGVRLRNGTSVACGCLSREQSSRRQFVHGETHSREYKAWLAAKDRCYRQKHRFYEYYGGRGISMCERWQTDFLAFLEDVGRCPAPGMSLDRFPDGNGNYEPGNVRWATAKQQANNRRPPCTKEAALAAVEETQARPLMHVTLPAKAAIEAGHVTDPDDPDDFDDDADARERREDADDRIQGD